MPSYPPLFEPKPVAATIWIVDGDDVNFHGIPFPTRMTLIRLENGDLLVHSPISLAAGLAERVEALGRVAHLVSPNWIHYVHLAAWAKRFPDAHVWASPGVREQARKNGHEIPFDRDLGDAAPEEWAAEVDQLILRGSRAHQEVVFFHRASRTLVLTDLIENFEASKVAWYFRPLFWAAGILAPNGRAPLDMRLTFWGAGETLSKRVRRMIEWAPERVILSHGAWIERDGTAALKRAFAWAL